jgi:hypothetical protein
VVVHGAAAMAPGHQLVAGLVDGGAVLEMEREVRARRPVGGAEQGDALPALGPLQIAPILGLPGEAQAKSGIEGLGPLHVPHPQGHMAKAMNSGRRHGGGDCWSHSLAGGRPAWAVGRPGFSRRGF